MISVCHISPVHPGSASAFLVCARGFSCATDSLDSLMGIPNDHTAQAEHLSGLLQITSNRMLTHPGPVLYADIIATSRTEHEITCQVSDPDMLPKVAGCKSGTSFRSCRLPYTMTPGGRHVKPVTARRNIGCRSCRSTHQEAPGFTPPTEPVRIPAHKAPEVGCRS